MQTENDWSRRHGTILLQRFLLAARNLGIRFSKIANLSQI